MTALSSDWFSGMKIWLLLALKNIKKKLSKNAILLIIINLNTLFAGTRRYRFSQRNEFAEYGENKSPVVQY